jgi:lipopolysaccharide biosynthesis glycosyltransferase
MKPTVFIQTNHKQLVGALVSAYALRRNSRSADEFEVRIMHHKDYPFFRAREGQKFLRDGGSCVWKNDDLQSFTPLRFMPPELMGYQGCAVVIDPDVFAVGDIYELLSLDMQGKALMCVARPGHKDRPAYYASSVMLLDCAQLIDWRCEEQFNEMFAFQRDYTDWLKLRLEPPERIGFLDPAWNHFDLLNDKTKLLHNTKRQTQPWKAGLPQDYTIHDKGQRSWLKTMKRRVKKVFLGVEVGRERYKSHRDPRQEAFFFGLLRECVEQGIVTETLLREEMRRDHLRHDALEVLERMPALT